MCVQLGTGPLKKSTRFTCVVLCVQEATCTHIVKVQHASASAVVRIGSLGPSASCLRVWWIWDAASLIRSPTRVERARPPSIAISHGALDKICCHPITPTQALRPQCDVFLRSTCLRIASAAYFWNLQSESFLRKFLVKSGAGMYWYVSLFVLVYGVST